MSHPTAAVNYDISGDSIVDAGATDPKLVLAATLNVTLLNTVSPPIFDEQATLAVITQHITSSAVTLAGDLITINTPGTYELNIQGFQTVLSDGTQGELGWRETIEPGAGPDAILLSGLATGGGAGDLSHNNPTVRRIVSAAAGNTFALTSRKTVGAAGVDRYDLTGGISTLLVYKY